VALALAFEVYGADEIDLVDLVGRRSPAARILVSGQSACQPNLGQRNPVALQDALDGAHTRQGLLVQRLEFG